MIVKYLPLSRIESAAQELIHGYSQRFGEVSRPPIPVDEILESYLGLRLDIGNLTALYGFPVLGAIWVKQRRVVIDESLDPDVYPKMEGRYRFTVGHEAGHWELHRHLYLNADQPMLFDGTPGPNIVCRDTSKKEPIEFQADTFSSFLLMPTAMIQAAWRERFGSLEAYVAEKELGELKARFKSDNVTLPIVKELSAVFKVSGQAMQIRLEGMKLLLIKTPQPDLFA